MDQVGRWVYQEEKAPHAFSLCRVLDAGTFEQSYDLLGVVQVTVDRRYPEKPRANLRPWALATLTTGGYGFGRFYASYSTLDEDGEPTGPSPTSTSTGPAPRCSPPRHRPEAAGRPSGSTSRRARVGVPGQSCPG